MIKGIDWKKALADDPELFVQQEKEIINDNLEIDATGWRGPYRQGDGIEANFHRGRRTARLQLGRN